MGSANDPLIRLFGTFAFLPEGSAGRTLSGPSRRLLVRLILSSRSSVGRAELGETLWPDAEPERGRFYLRRALTQLRGELGDAIQLDAGRERIGLAFDPDDVDALRFDRLIRQGGPSLEKAVELHTAPLLADWNDAWLEPERESRLLAWHRAIETLAENDLREGRPAEAARRLTISVAADPLRESGQRMLIEALRRGGDPAQAKRRYNRLAQDLRREVGLSPGRATRAALRQSTAIPPSEPAGDPERYLPVALTDLVGRGEILRHVLLRLERERLVCLVGPGGIGKTRLALAVAENYPADRSDLVAMIDLSSQEDGRALGSLFARSIGAASLSGLKAAESAIRTLGSRKALLLFDNCEHVLEDACVLIEAILSRCPGVRIMATSRESLGLAGEGIVDVPPLDAKASEAMFLDRAARKGKAIVVSDEAREFVARICGALDGLPLAVDLAAGALRTSTLRELSEDLYGALGVNSGSRLRHRSLRAAADWSYRRLSPLEARIMRSVAVIHGRWTSESAAAAAGSDVHSATQGLRRLSAQSLVVVDEDETGTRYRLLEPIREDAYRRLFESGEEEEVRRRLRGWAIDRTRDLYDRTRGHPQRAERFAAERVIDAIESVLQDCLKTAEGRAAGVQIVVYGLVFFDLTHRFREAADFQERFLNEGAEVEPSLRALALAQIVHFRCNAGEAERAVHLAHEAVRFALETDDPHALAYAISSQGISHFYTDRIEGTKELFEQALSLWGRTGHRDGVFSAAIWAGKAALAQGSFVEAHAFFDRAEAALPTDGGHAAAIVALNRARTAYHEGKIEAALATFEDVEETFAQLWDRTHVSSARIGRAACLLRMNRISEAAELLRSVEAEAGGLVEEPAKLYEGLGPTGIRETLLAAAGEIRAFE